MAIGALGPYFAIRPIILLAPFRLELFDLLPVELDAVGLNLLNDLVADLAREVGRLAFPLEPIRKSGVFLFRLLSFDGLPLPLLLQLVIPAPLAGGPRRFSPLNKGTQVIHGDIKLDPGEALLRGGFGGLSGCLFRVFFIFR